MRGNPYNLSIESKERFYIGARDNLGNYYYLTKSLANEKATSVFSSIPYSSLGDAAILTKIENVSSNVYKILKFSIQDGIIDNYSNSTDPIKFIPLNAQVNAIYPGIWYSLTDSLNNPIVWNVQNCLTDKKPFCNTLTSGTTTKNLDIILLPSNSSDFPISIWVSGACKNPVDKNIVNNWFDSWVYYISGTNLNKEFTPVNCDNLDKLNNSSNNCFFTSVSECLKGSLYTICDTGEKCGSCLGFCDNSNCVYDYAKDKVLSCDPIHSDPLPRYLQIWEQYKTFLIIVFTVVALIILGLLIWVIVVSIPKKETVVTG